MMVVEMEREVLAPKICLCGCEEEFMPTRWFQKYVNVQHREKYHHRLRVKVSELAEALGPEKVKAILDGTYQW